VKLLYYASASFGGLANYAQEQVGEISKLGIEVTVLCSPYFEKRESDHYALLPKLSEFKWKNKISNQFLRRLIGVAMNLWNHRVLKNEIQSGGYDRVLSVAYAEYMAPIWYRSLKKLSRRGVLFGVVVQEPVRDFIVGPLWWHKWSINCAYSFLKYAFVHEQVVLDTVKPTPDLQTIVIPYGPHQFPEPEESRSVTRKRLGIPEDAVMLLSFGHVRDNKNLQYSILALKKIPQAHLVVAGKRISNSQKPESDYIELAKSLGVADRCTWLIDYVTEQEAASLFSASDLVLLTYSSSFRSASGVLHLAARYRKQSIVSSGQGSLQSVLRNYKLGIWVQPDNQEAVAEGIKEWIDHPPQSNWEAYDCDNSWSKNAQIVSQAMGFI
jgi:glycosyltransferase involved in cell wall biosynthesis